MALADGAAAVAAEPAAEYTAPTFTAPVWHAGNMGADHWRLTVVCIKNAGTVLYKQNSLHSMWLVSGSPKQLGLEIDELRLPRCSRPLVLSSVQHDISSFQRLLSARMRSNGVPLRCVFTPNSEQVTQQRPGAIPGAQYLLGEGYRYTLTPLPNTAVGPADGTLVCPRGG